MIDLFNNDKIKSLNNLVKELRRESELLQKRNFKLMEVNHKLASCTGNAPKLNKLLSVTNEVILSNRKEIGLNSTEKILDHVRLSDSTGKTNGCGCVLCLQKHIEYNLKEQLKKFSSELKRLNIIESIRVGLEIDPINLNPLVYINDEEFKEAKRKKKKEIRVLPFWLAKSPLINTEIKIEYSNETDKAKAEALNKRRQQVLKLFEGDSHYVLGDVFESEYAENYGYIYFTRPDLLKSQINFMKSKIKEISEKLEKETERRLRVNRTCYIF